MIQEKIIINYIDKLWNKISLENNFMFTGTHIFINKLVNVSNAIPTGFKIINSKDEIFTILKANNMINKLSDHISIKVELKKEILLELIKEGSKEDKMNIYSNIDIFVASQYYGESDFNICMEIIQILKDDGFEKEACDLFIHMSKKIARLSSWKHKIYLNNIELIKDVFKNETDRYILIYLSRKSDQINNSQKLQVINRDFLLKTYSGNNEMMSKYQEIFPALKKYLESNDNDDFFINEIENNVNILIDLEKIKSIIAIRKWTNKDYVKTLNVLLSVVKIKDKNINKITTTKLKINKDKDYLNITVNVKNVSAFSEDQYKVRISKFMKMIKEHLPEEENVTRAFVDKCYSALLLEEQLLMSNNKKEPKKSKL